MYFIRRQREGSGEKKRDGLRKGLERLIRSSRTLIKTQDYLDVFARFKNTENITAVERVLGAHPQLEPFEKSQLGMTSLMHPCQPCPEQRRG